MVTRKKSMFLNSHLFKHYTISFDIAKRLFLIDSVSMSKFYVVTKNFQLKKYVQGKKIRFLFDITSIQVKFPKYGFLYVH